MGAFFVYSIWIALGVRGLLDLVLQQFIEEEACRPGHEEGSYGLHAQDFPIIATVTFAALAAWLLIRRLFLDRGGAEEPAPIPRQGWVFLGLASAVLIITVVLLNFIGILGGGPFVIAVFMFMMGERRPLPILATAVLAPLAAWGFFWHLLKFPLP